VPDSTAKAGLDRTLEGSPTSPRILAAMNGPMPGIEVRLVPVFRTVASFPLETRKLIEALSDELRSYRPIPSQQGPRRGPVRLGPKVGHLAFEPGRTFTRSA